MIRFFVLALAALAASCATPVADDGSEYRGTDYKTGSNLPQKRNRDLPVEQKAVDPATIPRNTMPGSRAGG